jgi:hypothetical protein
MSYVFYGDIQDDLSFRPLGLAILLRTLHVVVCNTCALFALIKTDSGTVQRLSLVNVVCKQILLSRFLVHVQNRMLGAFTVCQKDIRSLSASREY